MLEIYFFGGLKFGGFVMEMLKVIFWSFGMCLFCNDKIIVLGIIYVYVYFGLF